MKYLLKKGGFNINKQAPVIVDIIEAKDFAAAKKVAKSKGKEYTAQAAVKSVIDFDVKNGGLPKDFYKVWGEKLGFSN